ncbi:Proline-rich protein [Yarrowia sp. B02]|nr:Proline-rich protein [Yarrowia sp. B02]
MSKTQYQASPQPAGENHNGHVLPPEEQMPDELPPSYEESLDRPGGSGESRPPSSPRPSSSNSGNSYNTANSSSSSFNRSSTSITSGKPASGKGRDHSPGPPGPHGSPSHSPGRPPHSPGRPPHSPGRPGRQMGYGNRPQGGPAPNNPVLHYPSGYHCSKCNNTGVKTKNGKSCQDCWGMFARPNQQVVTIPGPRQDPYYYPGFFPFTPQPQTQTTIFAAPGAPPPMVVQPGDPRLGGVVCGKCRGRGMVYDWFLGDEQCPVCRGVGRVR